MGLIWAVQIKIQLAFWDAEKSDSVCFIHLACVRGIVSKWSAARARAKFMLCGLIKFKMQCWVCCWVFHNQFCILTTWDLNHIFSARYALRRIYSARSVNRQCNAENDNHVNSGHCTEGEHIRTNHISICGGNGDGGIGCTTIKPLYKCKNNCLQIECRTGCLLGPLVSTNRIIPYYIVRLCFCIRKYLHVRTTFACVFMTFQLESDTAR